MPQGQEVPQRPVLAVGEPALVSRGHRKILSLRDVIQVTAEITTQGTGR